MFISEILYNFHKEAGMWTEMTDEVFYLQQLNLSIIRVIKAELLQVYFVRVLFCETFILPSCSNVIVKRYLNLLYLVKETFLYSVLNGLKAIVFVHVKDGRL